MGCEGSGEGVVVGWGGRGMDVCVGGEGWRVGTSPGLFWDWLLVGIVCFV